MQVESGGTVDFQGDSLTLATGGQVGVKAGKRTLVRDGAQIDVSGAIGVAVSMESNNLKINVQGNEQRDAPMNRDSGKLNNGDIWLDRRELIRVASGSGGYDGDRWYSGGGLLEVGGYLGTMGVPVSHWLAQGGQVRFEGAEVVTQKGSSINLSGGTLDVRAGTLQQTWLRGADGRLYVADKAPGDVLYTGVYQGYEQRSARWGEKATRRFYNPLLAPRTRYEDGYTVGRDAGTLLISTRSAVLEGDLVGDTYQGTRQDRAPQSGLDGYSQSQRAAARRPAWWSATMCATTTRPRARSIPSWRHRRHGGRSGAGRGTRAGGRWPGPGRRLAAGKQGQAVPGREPAQRLRWAGCASRPDAPSPSMRPLRGADGGEITLYAPDVDVKANLTSRGGLIQAGNVLYQPSFLAVRLEDSALAPAANQKARLHVSGGVMLDARGVWANLRDADGLAGLPVRDGGRIAARHR